MTELTMDKVYLRREPTTDSYAVTNGVKGKQDVVAYKDKDASQFFGRWPWYLSTAPKRTQARVTLNCFDYEAIWLEDLAPSENNG